MDKKNRNMFFKRETRRSFAEMRYKIGEHISDGDQVRPNRNH